MTPGASPGPTFVVVYTALIVGLLLAAMLARREIRAEPGRMPSNGWDAPAWVSARVPA